MYHFFVEPSQVSDRSVTIVGDDVNHIKNVIRLKIGDEVSISNGTDGRDYRCGIIQITDTEVLCEVRFIKEDGVELSSRVYLFQGLPKGDKMELIIQKMVELGVYEIIPVAMKRCVVKLDDKKGKIQNSTLAGDFRGCRKTEQARCRAENTGCNALSGSTGVCKGHGCETRSL